MKIDFEFDTPYGKFADALVLDEMPSAEVIEAMKQKRLDDWIAIVTAPSEEVAEQPAE
jgi:hypothetical protein